MLTRERQHVPDILECLAQLSSDEVPTPPKLANAMLDLLPAEVWRDPELRWLDPCSKSGVYLREIVKRLLFDGLVECEPDFEKRREHIFRNMIFGCAITEITGIVSRRTVYYSRHAAGEHSVVSFGDDDGNLPFVRAKHDFKSGRCHICGAPEELERGEDRENYAYAFIHGAYPTEEMKEMKFDVIVGNPPYQIGSGDTSESPLYDQFVERAIDLDPKYVLMITPSRWFTGGKGLSKFRDRMISDRRIEKIVDNPKLFDCFPGVEIKGGVNYFLWNRDYEGDCKFSSRVDGEIVSTVMRDLRDGGGVVLRSPVAAAIVEKVRDLGEETATHRFSSQTPFGIYTNFEGYLNEPTKTSVRLYRRGLEDSWVERSEVAKNEDWIDEIKVLIPKAGDGHGRIPAKVLGDPLVAATPSACTQTFLVAGRWPTDLEAENFADYLRSRFVRFLVFQRKISQDTRPDSFGFVPDIPMNREWTDADLYERYRLTNDEIDFIESQIKEMPAPESAN